MARRPRVKKSYPKVGTKSVKSNWEYKVYEELVSLMPSGSSVEYEKDKFSYVLEKVYNLDWTVTKPDGSKIYIETKGFFDSEDRAKHLAIKKQHPNIQIYFLFMKDQKIHAKSSTRYSDWCLKNGFPYAIGTIPNEWLT